LLQQRCSLCCGHADEQFTALLFLRYRSMLR
jgi:hypothetical protein